MATGSVRGDANDCAIWIDRQDPSRSFVIGNDKTSRGALYLWDLLTGEEIYQTQALDQQINPDVRQEVRFGEQTFDLLGCGLAGPGTIKIYAIDGQTCTLRDITDPNGILWGNFDDLYGFTFYHRPSDGALFCIVSQAAKGANLHQIRLDTERRGLHHRQAGASLGCRGHCERS